MLINQTAIVTLVLCLCAAVSSTRLFFCRFIGLSGEKLYCWIAILPVLLLYPTLALGAQASPGTGTASALCMALAFGLAFSLASLRTPKLYARIVGGVLLLIYGVLFYYVIRGLRLHATPTA